MELIELDINEEKLSLTINVGVVEKKPAENTLQTLLVRADKSLYQAKATGRNCVIATEPAEWISRNQSQE